MTKTMYIIRGLPSSGKTTLATKLRLLHSPSSIVCEADQYFYKGGDYSFDPSKLNEAHKFCRDTVKTNAQRGVECIIVSNTSTKTKEITPYIDIAKEYGYEYHVIVVERHHDNKNDHNVPEETMQRMEQNLKNSIKLR